MSHRMFQSRTVYRVAGAALIAGAASTTSIAAGATPDPGTRSVAAADRTLRVYDNNIENLVMNGADGACTRISGPDTRPNPMECKEVPDSVRGLQESLDLIPRGAR